MATAQRQSAEVVKLKPRKAKGAKSTGGRKPASRMKPQPHEAKPKAPAQPTDAEIRRANQDKLVALRQKLLPIEAKKRAAQEVVSGLGAEEKAVRAAIQTIVPLEVYTEADKKLKLKTKRSDQEAYEAARSLAFEAFGLAVGPQAELELAKVPDAVKPALHWRSVGYMAAMNGEFLDPKRDGVPDDMVQEYMAGGADVQALNARGLKALKEDEKKAAKKSTEVPPASIPGGEAKAAAKGAEQAALVTGVDAASGADVTSLIVVHPDGVVTSEILDNDPLKWTDEQREAFKAWFDGLAPDAEVDIIHKGLAQAFDEAMDALEEMERDGAKPADDFEATEEELQAQNARRAVQEANAHAPSEFDD